MYHLCHATIDVFAVYHVTLEVVIVVNSETSEISLQLGGEVE